MSNNECVDCPSESTSSGTDATFCTCSVNRYAKKSGNTWTCEPCKTGQTKAATAIPSTEGEDVSDCTNATSCEANHYLVVDADSLQLLRGVPGRVDERWLVDDVHLHV